MCLEPHCDVTLIALVTAIGVWAIGRCLSESAANGAPVEDPQFVVIDEWAGLLIPLALTTPDEPALLLAAFVLFRLFDILKPWPVSAAERLPGAWGVMADDLVAGGLAAAVLYGGLRFFA
jgi:phosphatidylglycerophosphatase A